MPSDALDHPHTQDIKLIKVLAALADPVRLEIVRTIAAAKQPLACNAILSKVPKSTASHHWKVLREAGVIRQTRHGTSKLNIVRVHDLEETFPGLMASILSAIEE